ncbi:ATP-grasp domain-containing protein [Azospirillum rugosum]|uniref:Biotin carboxylase n=1 Tax=Azospirillum rugosum TaxID=416170 RepID=A0ABS4SCM5_9PROT|nr:ATP-grasp domain-containing protein [Azospirillum rugosum]MBP2290316.1 biotin carboxylase [Azospirillum rugosum]MDQ0527792.1 biotin carboxylase [Azospirillum rugosum]
MKTAPRKTAVIVDPYSTGILLAPRLRARGYQVVAVQSRPDLAPSLVRSYRAEDFAGHIAHDGDLAALTERLRPMDPAFVLPGNESAVELTDALSDALGTPGNSPKLTAARRNKFMMIERLAAAGLLTARQTMAGSAAEAVEWAAQAGWPVVAKPLASASTDHVYFCSRPAELRAAAESILGSRDFCGTANDRLLVQTYLDGEEYVVNTVSHGGRHYVCDVLHSAKRTLNGSPFVYDYYRLLPPDDATARALMVYIRRVLDALEITDGAGHAEVRMTSRGPALVEIAARAMGPAGSTTGIAAGTGHDQVDLLVDAFDGAATVGPLLDGHYRFQAEAMVLYLPVLGSGRVEELPDLGVLDRLESVRGHALVPQVGDVVAPTLDLTQILAKVYLAHPDRAVFERDWAAIRAMEDSLQPRLS